MPLNCTLNQNDQFYVMHFFHNEKKKNGVTQADYTFWEYDHHLAPPRTEGLVLSLLLTSTCSRMEKHPQYQDLHIKKDSCIWQMMHHYMTSKELQGHLTAHFLLRFPLRQVLQGYEIQCFVFFNSLTFKTQRQFYLSSKKKSLTLKNPKTQPSEMTSGCNWQSSLENVTTTWIPCLFSVPSSYHHQGKQNLESGCRWHIIGGGGLFWI